MWSTSWLCSWSSPIPLAKLYAVKEYISTDTQLPVKAYDNIILKESEAHLSAVKSLSVIEQLLYIIVLGKYVLKWKMLKHTVWQFNFSRTLMLPHNAYKGKQGHKNDHDDDANFLNAAPHSYAGMCHVWHSQVLCNVFYSSCPAGTLHGSLYHQYMNVCVNAWMWYVIRRKALYNSPFYCLVQVIWWSLIQATTVLKDPNWILTNKRLTEAKHLQHEVK